jgi:hypothetical protein
VEHEKEGIFASIERSAERVTVKDFEIEEGLLMAFGEEHYLPAFKQFVTFIEAEDTPEIIFDVSRSGYRMLLARFGYALEHDVMVKRKGDEELAKKSRLAAATFNSMSGSAFSAEALIKMQDGILKPVSELDVGEEVAMGGIVTTILRGRQRNIIDLGSVQCGSGSGVFHNGEWIRAKDHPDATPVYFRDGMEGYTIGTMNHRMVVNDEIFSDFYETVTRYTELSDFSDQAVAIMNAMQDDEVKAGWTTRLWRREELDIVKPWWGKMKEAGYGDWGDGPAIDEIGRVGFLAELEGKPIACVFLYFPPSARYAAVYSAICDVTTSYHACFRGISLAAKAAIEHCREVGVEEIVCHVHTPAVVKSFEMAGFRHDDVQYNHVYLCDEVIPWLEP